jgi:hypothetical protein
MRRAQAEQAERNWAIQQAQKCMKELCAAWPCELCHAADATERVDGKALCNGCAKRVKQAKRRKE